MKKLTSVQSQFVIGGAGTVQPIAGEPLTQTQKQSANKNDWAVSQKSRNPVVMPDGTTFYPV